MPLRRTIVALATFATACSSSTVPDAGDTTTVYEIATDDVPDTAVRSDRDRDGLCDDTETMLRTNPDDPDTDDDGLTDGFEVGMYTSPLSATDPPPSTRMSVREIAAETAMLPFAMGYHGTGETLVGFALDRGFWFDGRGLAELGLQLVPVAVSPRGAVGDLEGPEVTSVLGIVTIEWRASITWPSIAPEGCRRAYGGYGSVLALGRGLVWLSPIYLDVQADPNAMSFDAGMTSVDGGDARPTGPWPYVTHGFCSPPPGNCR